MNPRNVGDFFRSRYGHDRVEAVADGGFLVGLGLLSNPVTFVLGVYTLGGTAVLYLGKAAIKMIRR